MSQTAEQQRLNETKSGQKDWKRWGSYISERQWGTVREDYSPHGNAWHGPRHDPRQSTSCNSRLWDSAGYGKRVGTPLSLHPTVFISTSNEIAIVSSKSLNNRHR